MEWHYDDRHARATDIIDALPENKHSDVIFVLGSAHSHDDIADVVAERFRASERAVIISGHANESANIKALAVARGVPPSRIECENNASNTLENFLFSEPLLHGASEQKTIEIICKDYSAPRVFLTATKTLPQWTIGIHSYRLSAVTPAAFLDKFVAETQKIEKYASKGDITSPDTIGLDPDLFVAQS
ncbi:YdcF family protein [uncultured Kushneria sp.]|uniref:YdcF family protein n=1 Tax=uncultured Kushneria sp. TaxID=905033 RepID=UPI0026234C8C|nr:YdcF family protein [uncultured Kushneria sp.]